MPLNLPEGKTLAVNIGADFDAQSLWMGVFNQTSPSALSRGEFGAEVAAPRLLRLFERYGVRATWCTPAHTMMTFPHRIEEILAAGTHEIAAHGCYHETVPSLAPDEERHLMERTLEVHEQYIGKRPRGYRSPAWDFTDQTLGIIEEFGFEWDSSLMGRDLRPYHPRPVTVHWEEGNVFGDPSPILELPVSWFLDDFPALEYVPGAIPLMGSTEVLFQRFKDHFDFAYENEPGGVLSITLHPQTAARAHVYRGLEKFLEYMASFPGTWFATLSEIYDTWTED